MMSHPFELPAKRAYIWGLDGRVFDVLNFKPEDVRIEEIAASLSRICRWGGRCKQFYSVAEHSVFVSQQSDPPYRLQGLIHDATEAFVGDMVRPIKELLPMYQAIENSVWQAIATKFGVDPVIHPSVHKADDAVLVAEWYQLMESPFGVPQWVYDLPPAAKITVQGLPPKVAEKQFMKVFNQLVKGTHV